MKIYVILLLQRMKGPGAGGRVSLEPAVIGGVAKSRGVQLLDIVACAGIFDAVLICRAPDNQNIARLLDALDGWHTDALLATSHVRYVPTGSASYSVQ